MNPVADIQRHVKIARGVYGVFCKDNTRACAHTHTESGKREERMSSGNCSSVDGDLDNEHFWVVCLNQGYLSVQTLLPLAL